MLPSPHSSINKSLFLSKKKKRERERYDAAGGGAAPPGDGPVEGMRQSAAPSALTTGVSDGTLRHNVREAGAQTPLPRPQRKSGSAPLWQAESLALFPRMTDGHTGGPEASATALPPGASGARSPAGCSERSPRISAVPPRFVSSLVVTSPAFHPSPGWTDEAVWCVPQAVPLGPGGARQSTDAGPLPRGF